MKENRKVAVVTGAAGGIGKVIVNMFADNGFTVIAVDVNSADFSSREIHFQKADRDKRDFSCLCWMASASWANLAISFCLGRKSSDIVFVRISMLLLFELHAKIR